MLHAFMISCKNNYHCMIVVVVTVAAVTGVCNRRHCHYTVVMNSHFLLIALDIDIVVVVSQLLLSLCVVITGSFMSLLLLSPVCYDFGRCCDPPFSVV